MIFGKRNCIFCNLNQEMQTKVLSSTFLGNFKRIITGGPFTLKNFKFKIMALPPVKREVQIHLLKNIVEIQNFTFEVFFFSLKP